MRKLGHRVPGQRSGGPLALSVVLNSSKERLLAVLAGKHASGHCCMGCVRSGIDEARSKTAQLIVSDTKEGCAGGNNEDGSRARQGLFPKQHGGVRFKANGAL